ncbi:hypothetical protein KFL_011300020 [Klebsormidium nitens]|uniref:SF3 helicase domain-containing protein n=1 Tax=Klebsormidium nitens TaxID=105231 RepID=A0A1Y1ITV8_KLENI|nr:hypothetical protein KFL_011300020 [Klebsormidium nitens]|eukprot:GAQ92771.1 hypothetical protein KFL_011300020 [Klebsormidium nitens]
MDKESEYSHTGCAGDFKGKYYIKTEHYDEFMALYNAALKKKIHLSLTEKHKDQSPIFIDFDFKQDSSDRIYTAAHIKGLYDAVIKEASNYVWFDEDALECFVLEKAAPRPDKNHPYKDGFHLHFPDLVTCHCVQHMIRTRLLESGTISGIFADVKFRNSFEDVYDSAVIDKNPLLLYGSTKDGTGPAYTCTYKLWGEEGEQEECEDSLADLTERLSIRNKDVALPVLEEKKAEVAEFVEKRKAKAEAAPTKVVQPKCNIVLLGEVEQLIAMLSPARADNRSDWIALGSSLHSVDEGLLPVWDTFSQLSSKYQAGECEKLWYDFKPGNTIRSLHYWAKLDNPGLYKKYNETSMQTALLTSLSGSHYDVAQVVYSMFKFDYVSTKDQKNNPTWYKFSGHRWEECVGGVDLRNKLSTDVYKAFVTMSKECSKKAQADVEDSDDDEEKDDSSLSTLYRKIGRRLKNNTFKGAIMKECADIFYMSDKEFTSKLDESPHLLGFENGVYDLDAMEFRAGRPSDFLTLSTGSNYTPQVNLKVRTMLLDLLKDIYGTDEMIKYMLQFGAYTLHGSKTEEIIHFWVGKGGNGKGIMLYLFMKALGDYCYCPDVSIFTGSKKSSSAANSEIAKGQGKRLWAMTEPAPGDKFNTSELKKKSGRDPIQARHLYKQFFEYLAQFVLVFQMNNKSALDSYDEGMVGRLRLIEHKYQFVANPTKPNERHGDENLKNKISDDEAIREEFMRMLIEAHVEIKIKGKAKTPKAVTEYTKSYMDSNNVVAWEGWEG